MVIGGKGVKQLGVIPRAARLVDTAPTIAALLGCAPRADGTYVAVQDGEPLVDVLDPSERPEHVIGFLFDGTNSNVLYDMCARGEAPNVARLIDMGVAFGHGAMSSLPTVTLANHTSILTGSHPGHHGILNNAWFDRVKGEQVITNSQATWPWCMQHLDPRIESIHDVVHRTWPDAFTASVNEPCDKGANFSTFDFFRRGEVPPIPKDPFGLPHTTERFVRPSKDYSWSSVVDHMGIDQALGIIGGHYRDVSYPMPRFMWCNFTLTDAAMHEGGPHSEMAAASVRDSDGRVGTVLDALEQRGVLDDCAFVLVADHGMEENDPACNGDWDVALREAGVDARDEAYSFLYLGT
jgi:predicted AlkP superfamily pyrophosphatase or phosphodiesterase